MASIKWFRGAGKRVLSPRRDKPKAPKNIKLRKPRKLGLTKFPKLEKPRVSVPFIQSNPAVDMSRVAFGANESVRGLASARRLADKYKLSIGPAQWVRSSEADCPDNICDANTERHLPFDQLSTGGIGLPYQLYKEDGTPRQPFKTGPANGLWSASHPNCRCYVSLRMIVPGDPSQYLDVDIFTDPAAGTDRSIVNGMAVTGGSFKMSDEDTAMYQPSATSAVNVVSLPPEATEPAEAEPLPPVAAPGVSVPEPEPAVEETDEQRRLREEAEGNLG